MRNSHLLCPRDHSVLAIDELEEEGQALVTHRCIECPYTERAPGQRPQSTGSPFMAGLRRRAWAS